MADTKITALTALTAADPANDVIPIVDVSDTSMAASGTTKKISVNNILGASGTATLASATITGALTIGGATSFPASVINTSGGNPVFTPTASTLFLYSGSAFLSIRNQGNTQEIFNLTPAGVYTFGDGAGGTRMTLNSTGLGVGVVPAGTGGCLQLKSGITFPATQVASSDANTLDDYEEGTFTATVNGATTNPTVPLTATGRYTKIGRQVSISIYVSGSTVGASGRIQIEGLPFANNASVEAIASVGFDLMGTFTGSPFGIVVGSGTIIYMHSSISSTAYAQVTHNAGVSRNAWVSLTYTV